MKVVRSVSAAQFFFVPLKVFLATALLVMVTSLLSIPAANADTLNTTLTSSTIGYLGINTTNGAQGTRNIAILTTTAGALQNGCAGVWFDADQNKATYAMLLTAITTQKDVYVAYETQMPSPWGNTAWCGLIVAYIKP